MIAVSSVFIAEINKPSSAPVRKFTLGGSDYTSRVTRWAPMKFRVDELQSSNPTIVCLNDDGHFNYFIEDVFQLANAGGHKEVTIQFGYDYGGSSELITLYTGDLRKVNFNGNQVSFKMRDKLWQLAEQAVVNPGSASTVEWINIAPSQIIWDICTSYGGLSSVASTNNPDIDYTSYVAFSSVFSANNILMSARFDGDKCQKAISEVLNMAISTAWVNGAGQLVFRRLEGATGSDYLVTPSIIEYMDVLVDDGQLVNKQFVFGAYDVSSEAWGINVNYVASDSVNSYGTREGMIKSDKAWYSDSNSCLEVAQRQTFVYADPTKSFEFSTRLQPCFLNVGDTVRIVSSFYGVTSAEAFRIQEMQTDIDKGLCKFTVENTAIGVDAFILDVSLLNSGKLFL